MEISRTFKDLLFNITIFYLCIIIYYIACSPFIPCWLVPDEGAVVIRYKETHQQFGDCFILPLHFDMYILIRIYQSILIFSFRCISGGLYKNAWVVVNSINKQHNIDGDGNIGDL